MKMLKETMNVAAEDGYEYLECQFSTDPLHGFCALISFVRKEATCS